MKYYTKTLKTITLKVSEPEAEKKKMLSSRQCFNIAKEIYKTLDDDQEHFTVFFLNTQNEINGFKTIFSGGQNFASVDLKVVFRNALQFGAAALIIVHNHPSNCINPSQEDRNTTRDIYNSGKLLGIKLLDHLIITQGEDYYSFGDEGDIIRMSREATSLC